MSSRLSLTLSKENAAWVRKLPEWMDEPHLTVALNRLLNEVRGYTDTGLLDYLLEQRFERKPKLTIVKLRESELVQ